MAGYDDDANWNRCWIEWNEKRKKCNRDVTSGHRSRRLTIGLMVFATVATAVSTTYVVLIGGWVKHGGHLAEELEMTRQAIEAPSFNVMNFDIRCPLDSRQKSDSNDNKVLKGWSKDCHTMNENGTYVTTSTGFHILHTSLSFKPPSSRDSDETTETVFWQQLWRIQGDVYEDMLSKDVQSERCSYFSPTATVDRNETVSVCYRSEIWIIMRLAESDRIYVKVSHPHLVIRNQGLSFFGAIKIG